MGVWMKNEVLLDQAEPTHVRQIIFDIDAETGARSVHSIFDHAAPVEIEELTDGANWIDIIHWKWSDDVDLASLSPELHAYVANHRRMKLLDELKELLEAEEELAAQLADCRAEIKGLRGKL